MQRLRLFCLMGLVIAVGASLASAQTTLGFDDQSQNQSGDSKHDKTRVKDDDGHRKHWWSLPRFHHKKHDAASTAPQSATKSNSSFSTAKPMENPVAQSKPTQMTPAPASNTDSAVASSNSGHASAKATHPVHRNASRSGAAHRTTARTTHRGKTVVAAKPHRTTVAANKTRRKTVVHAGHIKKPAGHDCSPEEANKGGCQADEHGAKETTRASR